jgi:predicted NAD-dependent protein-ADP-ribosyltransferase YbiA (DUF1768 family)
LPPDAQRRRCATTDKPLNIWSGSDEEIGRKMSHFFEAPFYLDGVEFASVEAVYSWLIAPEDKRDGVRMLSGTAAKKAAPRKRIPSSFDYHGRTIQFGSHEHLEVIYRANVAKLQAHPDIAREFVATQPRKIHHILPHHSNPQDNPVFVRLLERLREEFAKRPAAK